MNVYEFILILINSVMILGGLVGNVLVCLSVATSSNLKSLVNMLLVNLAIATLNRQQSGDSELALEILDRALEQAPGHLRALYCRGLILLHMGEAEAALVCFQEVFEDDPSDADAAYQVGQSLMQLERPDEAVEWYDRAIELDPSFAPATGTGRDARIERLRWKRRHPEAHEWLRSRPGLEAELGAAAR